MSERGFHSTTQTHRHIAWQRAAKTSAIEVHIEASKILALFRRRTAVGRICGTTVIDRSPPLIMLRAQRFDGRFQLRPVTDPDGRSLRIWGRQATLQRDRCERIKKVGRGVLERFMNVENSTILGQRPDGIPIPSEPHITKTTRPASPELSQEIRGRESDQVQFNGSSAHDAFEAVLSGSKR